MSNENEIWKPVIGFEGYYEVSNYGRVRSLPRYVRAKFGLALKKGIVLKPIASFDGYLAVQLRKECKKSCQIIHRLVAIHFIEAVWGKNIVNHKDCNKQNNHVSNLEWVDKGENLQHAIENNRCKRVKGRITKV